MEKFDSQPRLFMLSTIISFKLMKSNHEYQIMKYFLATLCQNISKDGIMKLSKKNSMTEILMVYLNLYYWFMAKIWKNVSKFM